MALIFSFVLTVAQYGHLKPVDPRTFVSPQGHARLWVNPDTPYAQTGATYRLTRNGKVAWTKKFPFTLIDVGVSEDGTAAGYGYIGSKYVQGSFVVAVLRSNGTLRLDERHRQQPSPALHMPADPHANGLFFDASHDRFVVRIANPDLSTGSESWWTYRLSTGKRELTFRPVPPNDCRYIVAARQIPGTRLTLLNWWQYGGEMGAVFQLVDQNATPLWQLNLPGDYEIGNEDDRDALRAEMQTKGAILGTGPRQFEIRQVKSGKRVTYEVAGTTVREISRKPFVASKPLTPPRPAAPAIQLRPTGRLVLPVARDIPAIRDVEDFFFLADGRIAFLRGGDHPAIVAVDRQGKLSAELPLSFGPYRESEQRQIAWIGGTSFVLMRSIMGGKTAEAWRAELKTRQITPLSAFHSNPVEAVSGRADGSFVVLSREWGRYTISDELAFYDSRGRRQWIHTTGGGYGGRPEEMISPADVTFDSQGRIAVLDNTAQRILRFDLAGNFVGGTDFRKRWGKVLSYATNLVADTSGGLVIEDSGKLIRIKSDGAIRREWNPKLRNGKQIAPTGDPKVDSQGNLWITNRAALFRFDDRGTADLTLGVPPVTDRIRDLVQVHVDPSGRVIAVDGADCRVHVFDPKGSRLFVAQPKVGDFDERPWLRLSVARSGDFYLSGSRGDGDLHFASNGKRIGFLPYPKGAGGQKPSRVPANWRWVQNRLIDDRSRVITEVDRWPDLRWLDHTRFTFAPDGRFVAYESNGGPSRLALYAANGAPLKLANLPPGLGDGAGTIFDGERVYFPEGKRLSAVNLNGKLIWQTALPTADGLLFPSRKGLAWWDGKATVTWYAIP